MAYGQIKFVLPLHNTTIWEKVVLLFFFSSSAVSCSTVWGKLWDTKTIINVKEAILSNIGRLESNVNPNPSHTKVAVNQPGRN